MKKNQKMSTIITISILIVNTICFSLLYLIANRTMTTMMQQSARDNLYATLNVQTSIIKEYIAHQEDLLIRFGNATEIIDFLKDSDNEQKRERAQAYTEKYYEDLDNWEGLYIGEWNTHVIAHSNPEIVGMVTREGEALEQLQTEMLKENGFYNAGIIVSPASHKLVLSFYYPVFDYDGETIIGYVGGGPFAEELGELLEAVVDETTEYYMVNVASQMYIFAQDATLMATEIHDETMRSILSQVEVQEGIGDIEYSDETGEDFIAAYQYIPKYDWAVISCNSESVIYEDVNRTMKALHAICVASGVVVGLLSWALIRWNTRPLKYVEDSITQLKELNLEKDPRLNQYINGKSEVGQIATAIDSLYDSIKDMLEAEKEKQIAIARSESKDKFLASMSHEIRTPINTIMGMNEMILRENQDETIAEYATNIKSESHMLLGLVNDILDFSKIEAGKLEITESEYWVSEMLKDVVSAVEFRTEQKGLKLEVDISETMPAVLKGDEIRIKQVLNNLLSNAVKYTEKGCITFAVKELCDGENVNLSFAVRDTGIGIHQADMSRLFQDFERLELQKNRYIQGTGLGLYITKQLVENMGGVIQVESEHGKGSCFTVQLPQQIVDATPIGKLGCGCKKCRSEKDKEQAVICAPDAKVLVVDDNRINLKVMEGLLKRTQVQLDLADSGKGCLQKTIEVKYDLIFMDHMMPEMDGIQTLHAIKADAENLNSDTPVIMLTANAINGMEEKYLSEGFSGYLSKPVDPGKMEGLMKVYL